MSTTSVSGNTTVITDSDYDYYGSTANAIGNDSIDVSTDQLIIDVDADAGNGGRATASGIEDGTLTFNGSDLIVDINSSGQTAYAYGARNSTIYLTNDNGANASLDIEASVYGYDPSWGLLDSNVYTGDGADHIRFDVTSLIDGYGWGVRNDEAGLLQATGLEGSFLSTGNGADTVEIQISASGSTQQNSYRGNVVHDVRGIRSSTIDTGTGNDNISIELSSPTQAESLVNSLVFLGDGDDQVSFNGSFTTSTVDGGEGNDVLTINDANFGSYTIEGKDNGDVYMSGAGNDLLLRNVEEIHFRDSIYLLNVEPGISLEGHDFIISEDGNTATFTYKLDIQPVDPVTIEFVVSDDSEASLSHSSFTFTSGNWNQAQTLTVTGLSDREVDGDQPVVLSHKVVSDDLDYGPRSDGTGGVTIANQVLTNLDVDEHVTLYGDSRGPRNDRLTSGDGNDRIYGLHGRDILTAGYGNDRLYGGYDDDQLYGGAGNDRLYGEADDDRLYGGDGDDILNGGTGADYMSGGAGNDTYYVDDAGDVIDDRGLSTDIDTVVLIGANSFTLGSTVESATGNDANNTLTGNDNANTIDGGDGNDNLTGGGGDDVLIGGSGNDTLYSEDGDDLVDGGAGNDLIIGGSGLGDDIYNGGSGVDTLKYTSATAGITVDLLKGRATSTSRGDKAKIGTDKISSVENLIAGYHSDRLTGTNGSNTIQALSGNDWIYGAAGNDTINGGSGRDTAQFSSRSNRINLNTTKTQNTGDGRDRLISIENVNAGSGNDIITGNKSANTLNGQNGNDRLYGAAGNDTINGGSGRDTAQFSSRSNRINLNTTKRQNTGDGRDRLISIENVNAGSGNDIITGNKSANTLNGQSGNDRLYGGGGNDLLIGGGGKDRVWGQGGRDTFRVQRGTGYTIIEDFNDGVDRIQLGSGSSGLQLKTRGEDMYLYQRGDLMAIVEDAAGDLNRSGNFLV